VPLPDLGAGQIGLRHPGVPDLLRAGAVEYVAVDEEMRRLIHANAAEVDLERHARALGPGIVEDGWHKCVAGITSVDEVLRVTREE